MTQYGGDVERRNFRYMTSIVVRVVTKALREFFINVWNRVYIRAPWDDTAAIGMALYNKERKRPRAKDYLQNYKNGNTKEWDCSTFSDALLYSNALKKHLNATERVAVGKLRRLRNSQSHLSSDIMDDSKFDSNIAEIVSCFKDLNIPSNCTEELRSMLEQKEKDISFSVLPDGPESDNPVDVEECARVVSELDKGKINFLWPRPKEQLWDVEYTKYLWMFRTRKNLRLLSAYLSDVGKRWYDEKQNENNDNNFVMTLDGQSSATMMESYKDFARRVKCDKGSISKIMHSSFTDEMKIFKLKDEIKSRVKYWNSWLILVTNVEDLRATLRLLPQLDENEWKNGRILIATTDVESIPPDDEYHKTINWD